MRIPPHCDCGILSQLGSRLEQCDWAALAAPKPVQFQHGKLDACFCPDAPAEKLNLAWNTSVLPQAEYDSAFGEVQRAYDISGVGDRVETRIHQQAHRVDNVAAFEFMEERLKFFHS